MMPRDRMCGLGSLYAAKTMRPRSAQTEVRRGGGAWRLLWFSDCTYMSCDYRMFVYGMYRR